LKFVKYDGNGNGYLLILTNKKRSPSTIPAADEVPVAALYVKKDEVVAVSEQDFDILNGQGHIGNDRLHEVSSAYGRPFSRPLDSCWDR
jgi:diaminopimelate epimerase